jgi:hypothetical protein
MNHHLLQESPYAENGKILDFSGTKSLVNSVQGSICMIHFLFRVTKKYFITGACKFHFKIMSLGGSMENGRGWK